MSGAQRRGGRLDEFLAWEADQPARWKLIDGRPFQPGSHDASEPVAVFELLSRSIAWIDLHARLRDDDATPGVRLYVAVSRDTPWVAPWNRDPSGRLAVAAALSGLDEAVPLDPVDATLPPAEA